MAEETFLYDTEVPEKISEDLKVAFFSLISDSRAEKRQSAFQSLSSNPDPDVRKLAGLGQIIWEVSAGARPPESLGDVTKAFRDMTMSSFSAQIMEAAGQTLLASASIKEGADKITMLKSALGIISLSMSEGNPVSEQTIRLVRDARQAMPGYSLIDFILTRNESLAPRPSDAEEFIRRRTSEREKGGKPRQRIPK